MVVAYSMKGLRFKEIPFLDSFTSSTHFYGPLVYGLLLGGTLTGYYPAIAAFVLWGMASHALGAVQDITWDRLAAIGSISTVIGARATIILCFLLYLASASIAVGFYASLAALIIGLSLCLYPLIVSRAFAVSDETAEKTNILWKQFLWINQVTGFAITILFVGSQSGEQAMFLTQIAALVAIGAAYGYILQKWSTLKIAP
jgi:4-hydroxybenzoate polyprenyltransferase